MKRLSISILSVVLLLTFVMGSTYSADPPLVRYLVKIEGPPGNVEKAVNAFGGKVTHIYGILPQWIAVEIPEAALPGLERNPRVISIGPDVLFYAIGQTLPWGVDRIDADLVHPTYKGTGVPVAIIDTGIDLDHPDLAVANNVTFVDGTSSGDDDNGHGTHCAGIVAALDNEIGVIGVAPEASLYAVKVLDAGGSGWVSDIIAGIQWSVGNNMQIISMSLGSRFDDQALRAACDAAYDAGIILVAAAGNSGNPPGRGDNVIYPARYGSVIAVATTGQDDKRASWSSTGPDLELAAPGVNILSTVPGSGYESEGWSGTSMACPHVAGTAALVIASDNTLTNNEVRQKLIDTAEDLGAPDRDNLYGWGLVNAAAAVGVTIPEEPAVNVALSTDKSSYLTTETTAVLTAVVSDEDGNPISGLDPGAFETILDEVQASVTYTETSTGTYTGNLGISGLAESSHNIEVTVTDTRPISGTGSAEFSITSGEVDIVEIAKAVYNSRKSNGELKVEATSSHAPAGTDPNVAPSLKLKVYLNNVLIKEEPMDFDSKRGKYKKTVTEVSSKPSSIIVTSDHGGSYTMLESEIGGKSTPAGAKANLQNYPNPFNPETNIEYGIKETGFVSIKIHNILGQVVRTLVNEAQSAGFYTVVWNGRDEQGRELSSGIYYCRLTAGEQSAILKMLFLK